MERGPMNLPTAGRSGRVPCDLNKKLYTYEISDKIYKNEETPIPKYFNFQPINFSDIKRLFQICSELLLILGQLINTFQKMLARKNDIILLRLPGLHFGFCGASLNEIE